MEGIDQAFRKVLEADGVIFLPLTIILVGIIIFGSWRMNTYYRKELHDERENSKQDRREFLATLNELNKGFEFMRSDMRRIENKVTEIEKEVRK
ncbi:TPA: hypothetical protein QFK61_002095 [Enterococcus faecium]|jgi:hypothetical protein|uniref:Uncharacterized protein n=2 Tax=Lactobacillales TaxID=186826 RepID=A0A921HRR3_9LACO|nr:MULTISPECIES: hypothetical protein [Enterococcus]HJF86463.1 hypothetical protein [Companilactobacillus farciminis]EGP0010854.1 hypothetical protein [Enterococcus faecium]EGP4879402.1 hypothetical protein [Enterococcus faecium]EGP4907571.1 hypothetical protein [Enterococcus faecium]EGP4927619.1 hypothetical protein [Enterococcus faecium]